MPRTRGRKLRGQSEVIGGIIVLTALIISMGFTLTSVGKLSSSSVTGISRRTLFETEKSFEQLDAVISDGICYIRNTGNLPLTITRIWYNGEPIDIPSNLYSAMTLLPGVRMSVAEIRSILNIEKIDYVITSRGNVYPVESMCIQQQPQIINIYNYEVTGGGLFTSEQVLNSTKIKRGLEQGYIYVDTINEKGVRNLYAVVYNYSNTWYCSSTTGYRIISASRIASGLNTDIDENGIRELIISNNTICSNDVTYGEWGPGKQDVTVTFVFRNIVNVTAYPDVITLYFKVLITAGSGGVAQQVAVYPSVILYNENATIRSPATVTTGGSRVDVATVFGSAVFPVRAFSQQMPSGSYNLNITMYIDSQSIDIAGIRLEYLALIGAGYTVFWTFG